MKMLKYLQVTTCVPHTQNDLNPISVTYKWWQSFRATHHEIGLVSRTPVLFHGHSVENKNLLLTII